MTLLNQLQVELQSATSIFFTGSGKLSDLGRLLENIVEESGYRDARLVEECIKGIGTKDSTLIVSSFIRSYTRLVVNKTVLIALYI